jgi:hypothetical protein
VSVLAGDDRTERHARTTWREAEGRARSAIPHRSVGTREERRLMVPGATEHFRVVGRSHLVAPPSVPYRSGGSPGRAPHAWTKYRVWDTLNLYGAVPAQVSRGVNVREKFGQCLVAGSPTHADGSFEGLLPRTGGVVVRSRRSVRRVERRSPNRGRGRNAGSAGHQADRCGEAQSSERGVRRQANHRSADGTD